MTLYPLRTLTPKNGSRLRVSPLIVLLAAGVALLTLWHGGGGTYRPADFPLRETLTVAIAALLHELGHAAAAWGWRVPIRRMRLDLFGARMELDGLTGYSAELAVAAGGPFVSLAASALAWPLGRFLEGAYLFSAVSLGLGLINLLPVRGMDGGRMLACSLSLLFGERVADVTLRVTTGLFLGGLWLLSVYCLLRLGETLTLFTFALCLLLRLLGGDRP